MQLADLHATARQAREREFSSACETSARSTAKLSRSRAANFYAADSRRGFVDFTHGLHQPSRHRSSVHFPGNFRQTPDLSRESRRWIVFRKCGRIVRRNVEFLSPVFSNSYGTVESSECLKSSIVFPRI